MDRDDRRRADALDRYWDAILRGESPPRPAEIDDVTAAIVVRLGEQPALPQLDAAHQRVRRRIATRATEHAMTTLTLSRSPIVPNGWPPIKPARPVPSSAGARLRAAAFPLVAAALLLLAVVGLGARTFGTLLPAGGSPTVLPAAVASPATAAEETLLLVALAQDALPSTSEVSTSLTHYTLPPGARATWSERDFCCPGLRVEYVVGGSYAVRPHGPAQLVRAGRGGVPEAVPAGSEVILGPGDALLSRVEDAFDAANAGVGTVELLDADLLAKVPSGAEDPVPSNWVRDDLDVGGLSVPAAPAALRLRQVTLPSGAVLPFPPGAVGQVAVTLAGDAPLPRQTDGAIKNTGPQPVTVHVLTLEPAPAN